MATKRDPSNIQAHNNLGIAYATTGRLADARTEWRKTLELDPDNAAALTNLKQLEKIGFR